MTIRCIKFFQDRFLKLFNIYFSKVYQYFSIDLPVFERELALLVTLQGESTWKGWGGGLDIHSKVSRYVLGKSVVLSVVSARV